jgi:23S rRNA pseudouridine2605 synthase
MQKKSSHTSRPSGTGSKNTFKKNDGRPSFNKDARPASKKKYDGRPPAGGAGESRGPRKDKPYSGRTADGNKPERPYGRGTRDSGFGRDADSRNTESGGSRPFKSKPYSSRQADSGKPDRPFGKPAHGRDADNRNSESGSRPYKSKPYSGRLTDSGKPDRSFGKPAHGRDADNSNPESGSRPYKSKPYSGRQTDSGKPDRPFGKPAYGKDSRPPRGGERDSDSTKKFDRPARPESDSRPLRDRPKTRPTDGKSFGKREFDSDKSPGEERKPGKDFNKSGREGADSRPFRDRPKSSTDNKRPFDKRVPRKDAKDKTPNEDAKRSFGDVMDQAFNQPKAKKTESSPDDIVAKPQQFEDKIFGELGEPETAIKQKKPFKVKPRSEDETQKPEPKNTSGRKRKYEEEDEDDEENGDEKEINQKDGPRLEMPLNKFIAHSGECSRRDAAGLVKQGKVKVNGELVLDPGYRVKSEDKVTMSGKKLTPQKGMVYILLNKPKGFITTNDDPQGRKTVMELVGNSGVDRLFPVGRLDRDTSGLLLITNDGDLTQKLCHPSYKIKKVYQVTLDRPLTKADFDKIMEGVDLEDGIAHVDAMAYLENKNEVGLEIHSGRNRIVRRIFESLNYVVEKLDRVMYAGLTKKNLPRSKWRYLDEREVVLLKHFKS